MPSIRLQRKYFFYRHFPLPQTDADQGHVTFEVHADDSPLFIKPGDPHWIIGLKSLTGFAQSGGLVGFLLELGFLLQVFIPLAIGFMASAQGFLTCFFGLLAGLLQLREASGASLTATQITVRSFHQIAWQL